MTKGVKQAIFVAWAAWAAMLAGLSHALAAPAPIPADVIFRDDVVRDVALSPAGERIAVHVAAPEAGDTEAPAAHDGVVVMTLDGAQVLRTIDGSQNPVLGLAWASERRLLVTFATHVRLGKAKYLAGTRLVSIDVETGAMAVMFEGDRRVTRRNWRLGRVANMLPSDPAHVLMSAAIASGTHLWRVNVETGAAEIVERGVGRTVAWFTDAAGEAVLRIDTSKFGNTIFVHARIGGGGDQEWRRIKKVRLDEREDGDETDFWPVAPAPGDDRYYVLAHPEDEEFATIKLYDYAKDTYVRTVISGEGADVTSAIVDGGTGELLGGHIARDRLETVLLDEEAQAHVRGLDDYFARQANVRLLGEADGRHALLYVSGPAIPGAYYVYDYDDRHLSHLMDAKDGVAPDALGRMDVWSFEARDGTELSAYLTHPAGAAADVPAPLVVLVHGGPEMRDHYDYDPWVQYLASRGYRVLQPYFRGSSGKGRSFAEAGYGQWGGLMQDDVSDAVRILHAQGLASPADTCIVGASYGGYAALYGGAATPELYACAASLNGVTDLRGQLRYKKRRYGSSSEVYDYLREAMGDPKRDKDRMNRVSPLSHAGTYPIPVHIAHGAADTIVPVEQSRDMAKALARAGRPHAYYEYDGVGHDLSDAKTRQAYFTSLSAFLSEHIGGQP